MLKAVKVRLYPTKIQQQLINQTIGNCRWLWNYILNHRIEFKKEHGNYDGYVTPNPKDLKKEFEWLKLGSSVSLQQVQRDLVDAFRKIKKIDSGFPKFKKKKDKNSYREVQNKNCIEIKGSSLKVLKVGHIKFRCSKRDLNQLNSLTSKQIRNSTISKTSTGKYFSSILIETEITKKQELATCIGIDLGLKNFITTSDGEVIDSPKFFRNMEEKLIFQQRRLSKKEPSSNNWYKQKLKLSRIHEKIRNQRAYFLHRFSYKIISENQAIFVEDLNVEGMLKNHCLAKSISDASWSEFVRQLKYKSDWYGRDFIKINTFFPSSKTCSNCGCKNTGLGLSDRIFICPNCNFKIDRDYNASFNILNEGLRILNETTMEAIGSNACGVDSLESTMKQEKLFESNHLVRDARC